MPFPYNGNIPQPTDILSVSQPQILQNFTSIELLIDVDHADFANANSGYHNKVTMPNQGAPPVFPAAMDGIYCNLMGISGINETWIHAQKGGATTLDTPFTASILSTNPAPAAFSNGWTFLPSGLLLKWGLGLVASTALNPVDNVVFPVAGDIPVFTQTINVIIAVIAAVGADPDEYVTLVGMTPLQFSAIATQRTQPGVYRNVSVQYLAIGYV